MSLKIFSLVAILICVLTVVQAQTTTTTAAPTTTTSPGPTTTPGPTNASGLFRRTAGQSIRALIYTYDRSNQCSGRISNYTILTPGTSDCARHWYDSTMFVKAKKCASNEAVFSVHLTDNCMDTTAIADITQAPYTCVPRGGAIVGSSQVFCVSASAGIFSAFAVLVALVLTVISLLVL